MLKGSALRVAVQIAVERRFFCPQANLVGRGTFLATQAASNQPDLPCVAIHGRLEAARPRVKQILRLKPLEAQGNLHRPWCRACKAACICVPKQQVQKLTTSEIA